MGQIGSVYGGLAGATGAVTSVSDTAAMAAGVVRDTTVPQEDAGAANVASSAGYSAAPV